MIFVAQIVSAVFKRKKPFVFCNEDSLLFLHRFPSFLTRSQQRLAPAEALQYSCVCAACVSGQWRCLTSFSGTQRTLFFFFLFAWLMAQCVAQMNWMLFCFYQCSSDASCFCSGIKWKCCAKHGFHSFMSQTPLFKCSQNLFIYLFLVEQ